MNGRGLLHNWFVDGNWPQIDARSWFVDCNWPQVDARNWFVSTRTSDVHQPAEHHQWRASTCCVHHQGCATTYTLFNSSEYNRLKFV